MGGVEGRGGNRKPGQDSQACTAHHKPLHCEDGLELGAQAAREHTCAPKGLLPQT